MNVNDCPMCGEAPAKNDSICQECEDYINEGNDRIEQAREYYHNSPTVEDTP